MVIKRRCNSLLRPLFQLDDMVESLKIELFTAQRELVEKQEECEMIEKEITLVRLSVIALYIIPAPCD